MCIIVEKGPSDKITRAQIDNWHYANRDGWGIVFLNDSGEPVALRGMKKKALHKAVESVQDRAAYIHLRMGTAGKISVENTHPFELIPGFFFIHNGHISIARNVDKDKSDTWHFAELVLKPLLQHAACPHSLIREPAFAFMLEQAVGSSNRLVIFDKFGGVTFNNREWYKHTDGMRYSNTYAWNPFPEKKSERAMFSPALSPGVMDALEASGYDLSDWDDCDARSGWEEPDEPDVFDGIPDEYLTGSLDTVTSLVYTRPSMAADVLDFFGHSCPEYGTGYNSMLDLVTNDPDKAARAILQERAVFGELSYDHNPLFHD